MPTTKIKKTKKAIKKAKQEKRRKSSIVIDRGFLTSTEYEIESRKIQYGYHTGY